jgi:GcrA cell cycle regulator
MLWTAEAVEHLKKLALEGRSASAIAATLGAASRNAVIGKANRIGVRLNGSGGPAASCAKPAHGPQSIAVPFRKPVSRPWRTAWIDAEPEVGEMQRVTFEDILEPACRWPLGDPRSGDFVYCGLKRAEGHSYCAAHCRMAYRPPKAAGPHEKRWTRSLSNPWRLRTAQ